MDKRIEELLREHNLFGYCARFVDHDDCAGLVEWLIDEVNKLASEDIDYSECPNCSDMYDDGHEDGREYERGYIVRRIRNSDLENKEEVIKII